MGLDRTARLLARTARSLASRCRLLFSQMSVSLAAATVDLASFRESAETSARQAGGLKRLLQQSEYSRHEAEHQLSQGARDVEEGKQDAERWRRFQHVTSAWMERVRRGDECLQRIQRAWRAAVLRRRLGALAAADEVMALRVAVAARRERAACRVQRFLRRRVSAWSDAVRGFRIAVRALRGKSRQLVAERDAAVARQRLW